MTEEEIIRWLRRFQMDPEFREDNIPNGVKTVPLRCFAKLAGVRRATLYEMLRRKRNPQRAMLQRLTMAIEAVQGGVRWKKTFQGPTIMVGSRPMPELPRLSRHQ